MKILICALFGTLCEPIMPTALTELALRGPNVPGQPVCGWQHMAQTVEIEGKQYKICIPYKWPTFPVMGAEIKP